MALIRLNNAQIAFGDHALLSNTEFSVTHAERVALVGRNGAGKSTLMQILAQELPLDDGQVVREDGLKVTRLPQEIPDYPQDHVGDIVRAAAGQAGQLLKDYDLAIANEDMDAMASLQSAIDAINGWTLDSRLQTLMDNLALDPQAQYSSLSGGRKRMVTLAAALADAPDILLLDEPTNHLDLRAINLLEEVLQTFPGAVILITHDRAFLRRVATRIVELDRGKLYSYSADYDTFQRQRDDRLHSEDKSNAEFDRVLAEEEVWIRKGIKARRTRNEGRVRALKAMRQVRAQRRVGPGDPNFSLQSAGKSGKLVLEAQSVNYHIDGKNIIKDFSSTILRGDKIGILGPNGIGKTTLLRLLLGDLTPNSGSIRQGTQLNIAYSDQRRAALDPKQTVQENVAGGSDSIEVNGQQKHVISYLQDFLFSPQRARTPIQKLSGGERNRLMLAKLFTQPANLLVLDEPTNDLDLETLELLESLLVDYQGTLLVVSHDREFVDNVATSVIAFDAPGRANEYVGGYSDWLNYRAAHKPASAAPTAPAKAVKKPLSNAPQKPKLSYKERRQLEQIPEQITALENEQGQLNQCLSDPEWFRDHKQAAIDATQRLSDIDDELMALMELWEQLEERA